MDYRVPSASAERPIRFEFLDGLRGLTALYVVLHHAAIQVPCDLGWGIDPLLWLLRHGHFAVGIFIVLSGFCLMLPVHNSADQRLKGGFLAYLGRRARRILPPYYATLAICLLVLLGAQWLGQPRFDLWETSQPTLGGVLSHVALVHNVYEPWILAFDKPMWSVATEWQIYMLFPVLLIVWRRWGAIVTVCAGFVIGYPIAALGGWLDRPALVHLCPWYLGLFALGMAATRALPVPGGGIRASEPSAPRWLIVVCGLAAMVMMVVAKRLTHGNHTFFTDPVVGLASMALIVHCVALTNRDCQDAGASKLLRTLESRWAMCLGAFSYSLYLTHFPLIVQADCILVDLGWSPQARLTTLLVTVVPVCLLFAWAFAWIFERRSPRLRSLPSGQLGKLKATILGRRVAVGHVGIK